MNKKKRIDMVASDHDQESLRDGKRRGKMPLA